jgi:hypothetical protein
VYGWTVFGPQILAAFEREGTGDRRQVESELVRLLEQIVTVPAPRASRPAR